MIFAGTITALPYFPTADVNRPVLLSLRREDDPPWRVAAAAASPIDRCQANLLRAQHLGVGGRLAVSQELQV